MLKTVRIPSKLYRSLYEKGGDRLVAVFCIIKHHRTFKAHKSKNNKIVSGYGLIRKNTKIPLDTLKKYVPLLIDLGVVNFEPCGSFSVIGNNASKIVFNSYKMVPVVVSNSVTKTAYNSYYVRLHSELRQQEKIIEKKKFRSDLLNQLSDPKSTRSYKKAVTVLKRFGSIKLTPVTCLSNQSFSSIKHTRKIQFKKSNGIYWKKKLKSLGLIHSSRRFEIN